MILSESPGPYFGALLRQLRLRQATMEMKGYILSQRCLPPLGLRTWFKRMRQKSAEQFVYPVWLNKSFTQRCNLRARLDNIIAKQTQLEHPTRPKAYRIISLPSWTQLFEYYSAGATQLPLEVRHPLADLRLVLYALSVPLSPWIVNKHLLSAAMRSALPDPIRLRPKTPLVGNPLIQCLRSYEARWIDRYVPTPALTQYVDKVSIPQIAGEEDLNMVWMNLRPLSLNYWLQYVMTMIRPFNSEVDNECSVKG
jgi:asparagine synthase (glutamine-hydrolysing)